MDLVKKEKKPSSSLYLGQTILRVSYLWWLKMEKGKVLFKWRKSFIPRIAFKMKRRWVLKPPWMGGFHLTMIGREMNRWIFLSSSLVLRTKEIIDWWKLGKEGFPFILIGQGKGFWRRLILLLLHIDLDLDLICFLKKDLIFGKELW